MWGDFVEITYKKLNELYPYKKNPRNNDSAVDAVCNSIQKFGFKVPIVIDVSGEIVAGHTRYKAAKKLGIKEIPCIVADDLTAEQIKAFRLADNKVGELADWDLSLLSLELEDITSINMEDFGFKMDGHFWDGYPENSDEYNEFVEKFKPKKTTDDCYTPEKVYNAVKNWAINEYRLEGKIVKRPFYPGGDYKNETYRENEVVIDNPPFSIISEICVFYMEREIPFFLFAPALTLFSTNSGKCNYVICEAPIIYENGAVVATSFVTNMGEYKIQISSKLRYEIKEANEKDVVEHDKYEYPPNVITGARLQKYSKAGINLKIKNAEFIRHLDSQKEKGKSIYGSGFLISDVEANNLEKEAREKEEDKEAPKKTIFWELSEREKQIVRVLNGQAEKRN